MAKFLPVPTTPFDYHLLIGTAGASAAFVGAVALIFQDKNLADALVDAADAVADLQSAQADATLLAKQFEQAEARDNQSRALRAAASTLLNGVERALSRRPADVAATVSDLIDLALPELQAAMTFGPDEQWSISIYQAVGTPKQLVRLVSRRSNRLEEQAPSRQWRAGEGHIGTTFSRKYEVVLDDVNAPNIRPLLHTPAEKDDPRDPERYKSIAAVPIILNGSDEPWGVAIATSSRAGRFDQARQSEGWERAEAMRVLAGMIALAIATQHILPQAKAARSAKPAVKPAKIG